MSIESESSRCCSLADVPRPQKGQEAFPEDRSLRDFLSGASLPDDLPLLRSAGCRVRRLKRGETLFRPGERFANVYGARSGSFKTFLVKPDGREQVYGFFIAGDILGLDGMGGGNHASGAIALESAEVCTVPFAAVEELSRKNPAVQRHLHGMFAREIVRNYYSMMVLGSLSAMERLVAFLLNFSKRYEDLGY